MLCAVDLGKRDSFVFQAAHKNQHIVDMHSSLQANTHVVAASSYSGARALQCPHQGAKNSTNVKALSLTCASKVSFVKSITSEASDAPARAESTSEYRIATCSCIELRVSTIECVEVENSPENGRQMYEAPLVLWDWSFELVKQGPVLARLESESWLLAH